MHTRPDNTDQARAQQAAEAIWPKLDKNEQACVRFGMIPRWAAEEAEKNYATTADGQINYRDFTRLFAVAMMDQTKAVDGMIA